MTGEGPKIIDPETLAEIAKLKELYQKGSDLDKEKKEIEQKLFLLQIQRAWLLLAIFTRLLILGYAVYYLALWIINQP